MGKISDCNIFKWDYWFPSNVLSLVITLSEDIQKSNVLFSKIVNLALAK